ncbi:MAG: PH domain-containing protein [Clostridium sp.]|uniref:PH domain-containing protein n=1 Tax=Clostridium sp. TaxID=1506 RepID=UPI003D6D5D1A
MRKISTYSRKMWTIDGLITTGVFLSIAVVLNVFLEFDALWKCVLTISIYGLALIFFINSLLMPKYKFEKFTYDIDEEKIILKHGVFIEKNIAIPMKRIQYVDTEQGLILRKHKLVNLTVHTAGGQFVIPYLESEIGNEIQLSIAKIVQEKSI